MGVGLQEVQAVTVPFAMVSSVGVLEKSTTKKLEPSFGEIFHTIVNEIDGLGVRAAKSPSLSAFKTERAEKLYPVFVRLIRAISELLEAKVDKSDLRGMREASSAIIRSEVEAKWASYFSDETYREILFALGALTSAQSLVVRVTATELPDDPDSKSKNDELRELYNLAAPWSHFHFEVLKAAFKHKITIVPEVLREILDGLRLSVMAYAYVRQAVELRHILDDRYSEEFEVVWDEEDAELANAE
jgi:hypothetical protein